MLGLLRDFGFADFGGLACVGFGETKLTVLWIVDSYFDFGAKPWQVFFVLVFVSSALKVGTWSEELAFIGLFTVF